MNCYCIISCKAISQNKLFNLLSWNRVLLLFFCSLECNTSLSGGALIDREIHQLPFYISSAGEFLANHLLLQWHIVFSSRPSHGLRHIGGNRPARAVFLVQFWFLNLEKYSLFVPWWIIVYYSGVYVCWLFVCWARQRVDAVMCLSSQTRTSITSRPSRRQCWWSFMLHGERIMFHSHTNVELRTFYCKRVLGCICNSPYSAAECDGVSCPWCLHTTDSCDASSALIRIFVHVHKAF